MAAPSRARRALIGAALITAALSAPLTGRAAAHLEDPGAQVVLDAVKPALADVTVQVVRSVSAQLVVENPTDTELRVLADTGEVFLRIGPSGVLANLASPAWYASNSPFGGAVVPPDADPDAPPRWGTVATEPAWGWFDHRLHPTDGATNPDARGTRWVVPLQYGTRDVKVIGHVAARRAAATATVDVRRLAPRVDGLAVQVSPGPVPVVFVSWTGDTPLVVLGAAGEPFARFEPSGVEVNRHSSIWIDNARARDQDVSGLVAEALAEPEWVAVSSAPSFSWLEPRGALRDRRTRTWRVPFETATGRPVLIAETKLVDIDK